MSKKIVLAVFGVFVILVAGGGFFWWWQQYQEDVRELNKNLPEGIRVVKNFAGEYKVVNKIDGYEFRVPKAWGGLEEIEYMPERMAEGYSGTSINIEGNKGTGRVVAVDFYKSGGEMGSDLKIWAEANFKTFGLIGDFTKSVISNTEIVKTQENIHLGGEYVYFFRGRDKTNVYTITGPSEDFIQEIITNGKW